MLPPTHDVPPPTMYKDTNKIEDAPPQPPPPPPPMSMDKDMQ